MSRSPTARPTAEAEQRQGLGRIEPARLAILEQVHQTAAVQQRAVRVAVAIEVAPAEVSEGGQAGERPLAPPRPVGVVAKHRWRHVRRTEDHVEVPAISVSAAHTP